MSVLMRLNINNGSGDNNNNSNEGEKTNEDKVTSRKIVLEIDEKKIHCQRCYSKILKYIAKCITKLDGLETIALDKQNNLITVVYCNADVKELTEALENFSKQFNKDGDGSGGDKDKKGNGSGGGGGNDEGDNDGGDKTEDGSGKMGTKMEPKGQHNNRNSSHIMVEMRMGIQLDSCIGAIMRASPTKAPNTPKTPNSSKNHLQPTHQKHQIFLM